jgi:hypothetical protein
MERNADLRSYMISGYLSKRGIKASFIEPWHLSCRLRTRAVFGDESFARSQSHGAKACIRSTTQKGDA